MSGRDQELKKELDAAVETRRDLGSGYEDELIDGFLEKLEARIDTTVDKRVRRQVAERQLVLGSQARDGQPDHRGPGPAFGMAALSLVLAIPLSAIAVMNAGLLGLALAWGGIVGVNACFAAMLHRDRPQPRRDDDWR